MAPSKEPNTDTYTMLITGHKLEREKCQNRYVQLRKEVTTDNRNWFLRLFFSEPLTIRTAKIMQLQIQEAEAVKAIDAKYTKLIDSYNAQYDFKAQLDGSEQEFLAYLETKAQVKQLTNPEKVYLDKKYKEMAQISKGETVYSQEQLTAIEKLNDQSAAWQQKEYSNNLLGSLGGLAGASSLGAGQITNDPQTEMAGWAYPSIKYSRKPVVQNTKPAKPDLEIIKEPKGRKFKSE